MQSSSSQPPQVSPTVCRTGDDCDEDSGADDRPQHGKGCPLMLTVKGSARWSRAAIQGPMRAPMNPRAVETISPPRIPPAIAADGPQTPR